MTIENRRYCPKCDDNTVTLVNGPKGFFYACSNFRTTRCSFTQSQDAPALHPEGYKAEPGTGGPVEYSLESNVAQAQTRAAQVHAVTVLDEFASRHGMASCADIEQQLRDRIPGFGSIRDPKTLTDSERAQRGAVLGMFLGEGIKRMLQPLPYDKADRSTR